MYLGALNGYSSWDYDLCLDEIITIYVYKNRIFKLIISTKQV